MEQLQNIELKYLQNFEIIQNNTNDIISSGIARGFAQYDVGSQNSTMKT